MSGKSEVVARVVQRRRGDPAQLLQILREIQEEFDWISPETARAVAAGLSVPVTRVDSVVQFYSFLYDKPKGRYRILFSDNITDRMLGSLPLFEHMLKRLKLKRGEVSSDGAVSVDLTSCTGMCDQGPAILVNNRPVTRLTARRADEICDLVRGSVQLSEWPADFFRIEDNIRRADALLGAHYEIGSATRAAIALGRQGMLDEMKRSNLRGRGGAGFTTSVKWESCRNAPGAERYIVCNADEGEPGTFKDRVLLASFTERVVEGMAIAGFAVGAARGLLYLRGEYRYLLDPLEAKLQAMRRDRLLGPSICGAQGFDFDVEIHLGAGAYICGEESALIESSGGEAGQAAHPPAFPGHGRLSRQADGCRQRRDAGRRYRYRAARRAIIRGPRHAALRRHKDSVGLRGLRPTRDLRIFLRRAGGAGAQRLRRRRRRRGPDQWPVGRVPDP